MLAASSRIILDRKFCRNGSENPVFRLTKSTLLQPQFCLICYRLLLYSLFLNRHGGPVQQFLYCTERLGSYLSYNIMITHPNTSGPTVGDIARALFRHTKKIVAIFLLIVTATFCWIIFAPGKYESSAKIYVRIGRENNTLDPSATTGQTVNIQQTLEAEINSMLQILESRETAQRVVDAVGVDPILANDLSSPSESSSASSKPDSSLKKIKTWLSDLKSTIFPNRFSETREALAVRSVLKRSKFWAPKNSNVIEISCEAGHPELAQQIAEAWTKAFVDEHLRITKTEGSLFFFVHQAEQLKDQLDTVEQDLKQLKSQSSLVSIEGQRRILEDQSKSIRTRELANSSLLASSKAKISELQSILDLVPAREKTDQKTEDKTEGWYGLRQKLFELQIREHELRSKYSAENPEVIAVEQQREAIEQILAKQSQSSSESISSPNPTYQLFQQSLLNEQAQVVALLAEDKSLEEQRQQILDEYEKLNECALQISDLERQRQILETSYLASAARMEQAKILQGLENAKISSVSVLQSASFNARPSGMGRTKTLLLGMFLGLLCGFGFAATSEYFDRSYMTPAQVENSLEVPVLVSIPQKRHQLMEVS